MKRWTLTAVALTCLLLPAAASAQAGTEWRITPRAGLLTPADWFYVEFMRFGVQPVQWTEAAILRSTVAGLGAELALEPLGVWIRGELVRTLGAETAIVYAVLVPASLAGPAGVVRTGYRVATTLTTGTVDLALPLRFRIGRRIQPYITGGIGGKRYTFDTEALVPFQDQIILPQPGTVLAYNVGGGAVVDVRGLRLDLQFRDSLSQYWDVLQHDIMFLLGLSVRVR
jgi:opacity protein-like surface antigen